MDTLRQSEDYNWDFGDEHNEENELDLSPNEATYEQMMLDGQATRERMDYETSVMFFDAALSLKPNDVDALFNKSVSMSSIPGRDTECKELLEEVLALDQNHIEARKRLVLMESESRPEIALQLLPKHSPSEDAELKLYRAIILTQLKRYTEALAVLAKLNTPSYENHFEARLCRARAFRGNREFEPAYAHASRAVELRPNSIPALMLRASIALDYHEFQKRTGNDLPPVPSNASLTRLVSSVAYPPPSSSTTQAAKLEQSAAAARARESSGAASSSAVNLGATIIPTKQTSVSPSTHHKNYAMPGENTAALSRSKLASSRVTSNAPSLMPPIPTLLGNTLQDLNQVLVLKPTLIQAQCKRGTVFHILGRHLAACDDYSNVLVSPLLQAAERASVVLKLGRVLFELGDRDSLKRAHEEFQKQLYYALDLEVLNADVRVLVAVGTPEQLVNEERIINSCLVSMTDRGAVNAMPSRHRGPLLLLLAKLNKRIAEMKKLKQFEVTSLDSHNLVRSLPVANLNSSEAGEEDGESELHRCEQYAEQAVLQIEDVRTLMREASFWRQSGEADLAIKFARQAVLLASNPLTPSSSTIGSSSTGYSYGNQADRTLLIHAKLCLARELFARGKEAEVLDSLFGLPDDDAQVALYRLLAQNSDDKEKRLFALDGFLNQLTSLNSPYGVLPMDVKVRMWTTAQFHRAIALWRLQDRQQARFAFEEVLHSCPNHPSTLLHMAELLMTEGELSSAVDFFRRRLQGTFEKSLTLHLLMRIAHCHHMLGQYPQCLEALDEVLLLKPKHQEARALKEEATRLNTTIGSALAYTRETVSGVTSYLKKLMWTSTPSQPIAKPSINTSSNLQ